MRKYLFKWTVDGIKLRYAKTATEAIQAMDSGYETASLYDLTRMAREANFEYKHYGRIIGDRYIYPFDHSNPIYTLEKYADTKSPKVEITSNRLVIELTNS